MMHRSSAAPLQVGSRQDRRRGHRVDVLGHLHGHLVALRVPVIVRDIGSGGFSIETPVQFPDRAPHSFRFTTALGEETVLTAVSVRSARIDRPNEPPSYITGFEFVMTTETQDAVETLVETLTATAVF